MEHAFGREAPLALGMEEELLLVDPATHALAPVSSALLPRLDPPAGSVMHDVYEALVECASPVCHDAPEGARALAALREAGATLAGAGIHPDGAFGDAPHVGHPRYREDYAQTLAATVSAAEVPDYTFLWWDIRSHPKLGTLELRAMDAQARLGSVCGPAATGSRRRSGTAAGCERILREGNGAERMRAAHARGGMPEVLALLVRETAAPLSA